MRISIFGLGYVGCVSLGCLASYGHSLIGVDISDVKVDMINNGKPTIIEKDIDILISEGVKNGKIIATTDFEYAILNSDISIIAVGTPSNPEGHLNLDYIFRTAGQIGKVLQTKQNFHIIAIRSTVLPGTNIEYGRIIEKISGKKRNDGFAIISNPEFLREGSAVADFNNPPVTVLGGDHSESLEKLAGIYCKVNGPIEKVDINVAEIIKYVNNSYHALKIVFANEVGNICKKIGIDSHDVMRLFCMDKQLNISPYYFKPGFAYGGSCLPKDLKALKTIAHDNYLETPVLNSIEKSNTLQKEFGLNLIEKQDKKKILILGISFKSGTDDLRYSPIIDVIESLIGKGYNLKLYDSNVNLSKLMGQNKSYIMEKLPHIGNLLVDSIEHWLEWADVIVINNKEQEFIELNIFEGKKIIDLCRIDQYGNHPGYEGISW
jgi:GDP-mannose 6-dehydrogenase